VSEKWLPKAAAITKLNTVHGHIDTYNIHVNNGRN